jgi:hypothetical protein
VEYSKCDWGGVRLAYNPTAVFEYKLRPEYFTNIPNAVDFEWTTEEEKLFGCSIAIGAQQFGREAGEVVFVNHSGRLIVENNAKNIAYTVTHDPNVRYNICGEAGTKGTGTFTGKDELELQDGSIEVVEN